MEAGGEKMIYQWNGDLNVITRQTKYDNFISCAPLIFCTTIREKMLYQWNGDLSVITRQTKESKRAGEILEGLKLGGANSKGSSDADDI
jgi:hypothetical protein